MMALRSKKTHNITLKNLTWLQGPYFYVSTDIRPYIDELGIYEDNVGPGNEVVKNQALFRPKLHDSLSTNQIAIFGREQCCRIFYSKDACPSIRGKST